MMTRFLTLVPILAAMTLAGCDLAPDNTGDTPIWAREATVEALGRAYIELPPNRASFEVVYEERDPQSGSASVVALRRAELATEAIRQIAGDQVRLTSDLSVETYYQQITETIVRGEERREVLRENRHPDAVIGYVARVHLSVVVLDLEHVAEVRGAALALGPEDTGSVEFYLDRTSEVLRAAFQAAVVDATARAAIVAEESGDRIGRVLVLREGNQPCLGQAYGGAGRNDENSSDLIAVTASRRQREQFTSSAPLQVIDSEQIRTAGLVDAEMVLEISQSYQLASDFEPIRVSGAVCAVFAID
jgi:uncharacterized protein YggE